MEKRKFTLVIRNIETDDLKQITRTAYTIDEAEDKVLNSVFYPWVFARYETTLLYLGGAYNGK